MTNEGKKKLLERVKDELLVYRGPSSVAFYGIVREGVARLHGSGTLIQHEGRLAVLTAKHVLEDVEEFQYLGMRCGDRQPPQRTIFSKIVVNNSSDVAAAEFLVPDAIPDWRTRAIDLEEILASDLDRKGDALYLHGYPEAGSEGTGAFGELRPSLIGYLTARETHNGNYFNVSFSAFTVTDREGQLVTVFPPGWSGSACWSGGQGDFSMAWTPSNSKFAGVVSSWSEETNLLWISKGEQGQQALRDLFLFD